MIVLSVDSARAISQAMKRAAAAAINKSLKSASVQAGRRVRQVYNIKARDLKPYIKYSRANQYKLTGQVGIENRRLPLKLFGPAEHPRGITVRIRRDRGRVLVKHAFVAAVGGKLNIYTRAKKNGKRVWRLPIKVLNTVSPGKMFEKEGEKVIEEYLQKNYRRIFEHELDFRLERIGRGTR